MTKKEELIKRFNEIDEQKFWSWASNCLNKDVVIDLIKNDYSEEECEEALENLK